jgi:hypothetical protein
MIAHGYLQNGRKDESLLIKIEGGEGEGRGDSKHRSFKQHLQSKVVEST